MTKSTRKPPQLTAEAIQNALKEKFPEISPCHRAMEGCHHDVWFVGSKMVLRGLPATGRRDGKAELWMEQDAAVSRLLRRHMSKPEMIPEVFATININGWICNVEERAIGRSLEETQPTDTTGQDLVHFLQSLAAIPIEEARKVVRLEEPRPNMRKRVAKAIKSWNALTECKYVNDPDEIMKQFLKQQLSELLPSLNEQEEYTPVLIHGDISTEHILIDRPEGRIKGIIDWSEAVTGDPCMDISGLSLTVGRVAAGRLSAETSYSKSTIEKGFLYAMCLVITDLDGTVCGDDDGPEELLKREFGRVFEGTVVQEAGFFKSQQ